MHRSSSCESCFSSQLLSSGRSSVQAEGETVIFLTPSVQICSTVGPADWKFAQWGSTEVELVSGAHVTVVARWVVEPSGMTVPAWWHLKLWRPCTWHLQNRQDYDEEDYYNWKQDRRFHNLFGWPFSLEVDWLTWWVTKLVHLMVCWGQFLEINVIEKGKIYLHFITLNQQV